MLIENNLGEILSKKLNQLRITETEKYAHVTYFFNGVLKSYEGEDRVLIPSPELKLMIKAQKCLH